MIFYICTDSVENNIYIYCSNNNSYFFKVPPGKQMLLNCATCLKAGGWSVSKKVSWKGTHSSGESHEPGIYGEGLHEPF